MNLNIKNETDTLVSVILGIAENLGPKPTVENCIDPKTKFHILNNTYPKEDDCIKEIENFKNVLKKHNINVLRPNNNIQNLNQIFTRDISFVVEDKFFVPEIIKERNNEKNGINSIINNLRNDQKIIIPKNIKIEGGDIILNDKFVFIGYSENDKYINLKVSRTNKESLEYIQEQFPDKTIIGIKVIKNDKDHKNSILHLDCTMQPIGNKKIIIYENGIYHKKDLDTIYEIYGEKNLIKINQKEMYEGCSNIFSINKKTIVSDTTFTRLNKELERLNFLVEKVNYREISKFGGLFRCSTLPLERKS